MGMSSYFATVTQLKKMLGQLDTWIEKAHAFAEAKKFDANNLLSARLAPDQFPLVQQIRSACDAAKFAAARPAGKDAPKHADNETSFEELRARIKNVIAYLDGFSAKDFEGADERALVLPFIPGKTMRGADYFNELAVPNFYFHVTHAYAILRHSGVDLGKMDYTGSFALRDA
jgi:hypothetical protein